jgi:hypothetical protein
MILSSADILGILGGNEIIRLSAKLSIVDGKPALSGREGIYIYVNRFPTLQEFEATWQIWIESDEEDDLIIAELQRLLPRVQVTRGLMTTVSTTEFRSESTQAAPEASEAKTAQVDLTQYEERFQSLVEDVQDRMLLVTSGRAGKDGQDGRDGVDGRDGKDLVATDAELFDLKDVDQSILPVEKGQVLTWDGAKWTNLFLRQTMSAGGSAVSATGGGSTGVGSTIGWTYHPHDHTEEPNSGHFHTDSADGELVTVFHVSNETSRGNDVEVLLRDLLTQGYDRIYVALGEDLSQAHLYSITSYTETVGGFEINVTHVETAGLEPDYQNAKLYEFLFTRSAPDPGSVDNVTIVSETTPTLRDNGDALIQGDSWYLPSTDQLYLYIDGAWEEIKVNEGASGGVASGFWKFNDPETEGYDDGKFRVNSHQNKTDWSLTTELYVGYKTDDGANVKNILLNLVKPDQYVYIQRKDRTDAWVILLVEAVPVDADTKGCRIAVSFVSQGTAVADITKDKLCDLSFMVVSGGGGGGGATTLAELSDTNTVGAADADLLVYRSGIWTAETPASTCDYTVSDGGDFDSGTAQETGCDGIGIVGVVELDDLSDVDLTTTSPADNDLLVYDQASGNWLPTPNTVRNLGDFDGTNFEEGATIVWDAVAQIFKQAQHGADGITSAAYKYKNTLTGDPSNGHIALDNADPTLATEIRVHKTTTNNVDLSAVFSMGLGLAQGLYIQRKDDASEAHAYRTTGQAVDQGNYIAVPIEHVGGTGTFTNNKTMVIGVYARSEAHKISPVTAPASSTAVGTAGEVRYDANYFYICIADNSWKRFTLETW